jgi:hypothetical protein
VILTQYLPNTSRDVTVLMKRLPWVRAGTELITGAKVLQNGLYKSVRFPHAKLTQPHIRLTGDEPVQKFFSAVCIRKIFVWTN